MMPSARYDVRGREPSPPPAANGRGGENGRAVRNGQALFRRVCLGCHGRDGTGVRGRSRMPEIPDFTDARWQNDRGDAQLVVSVLEGKGSHMPQFGDELDRAQARDVVAFIRSLAPGRSVRGPQAANDFEERFRRLEEEMEGLRRQYRLLSESARGPG